MVPEAVKIFLNHEIRGDEVRGTRRLFHGAAKIKPPRYDSRYLETFPTVWATAHEFQQLIKLASERNADPAILRTAHEAVEEWVCLFLLHYCGVINPYVYKKLENGNEKDDFRCYDRDLWTALSRTFPPGRLDSITLLRADDATQLGSGTVVGGFYPGIFFFPSRGRAAWLKSEALRPYLDGTRLSWERCRKSALLRTEQDRLDFSTHLASLEDIVGGYKDSLNQFRTEAITAGHLPVAGPKYPLDRDSILNWKRQVIEDAEQLMKSYPLTWESEDQKQVTYFFINNMPGDQEFWMSEAIGRGMPAAQNFSTDEERRAVYIKHAGKIIRYELKQTETLTEKVVDLKDCFLSVNPFWCPIPAEEFSARIRSVHRVTVGREGPFASLREKQTAVCLAPVNSSFLANCSLRMRDGSWFLKSIETSIANAAESELRDLDWSFTFHGRDGEKKVHWPTKIEQRPDLSNNAVALWPPRCSDDWHFYVARCFGSSKSKSGTWILVDQNGRYDKEHKAFALDATVAEGRTDVTEYVSHIPLAANPTAPNKPAYLMLLDTDEKVERGVLFLDDSIEEQREKEQKPSATLAIDFGTSNTCLALAVNDEIEPLVFSLSPVMLWGRQPQTELPGRVPFTWQGREFYPTIFMSRKKSGIEEITPTELAVGNLFQIDIPSMHKGMENRVFSGTFDGWNTETNLKWKLRVEHNIQRQLFLALSLLYAHAEVFFSNERDRGVQLKDYVFSFPLAFSSAQERQFCNDATDVTKHIRRLCYGSDDNAGFYKVDESTAIAVDSGVADDESTLQVFIDVGGGTTDIAIRHREDFPARDSIKVAGRTFFGFAEENFNSEGVKGSKEFRTNLGRLLLKEEKPLSLDGIRLDLGTYYSLAITGINESDFRSREDVVLEEGMGNNSYQRYRSLVFFRQIVAYALLQAFAAAATNQSETEIQTFEIVLAGNAWGLAMFAELKRREAVFRKEIERIFRFLKQSIHGIVSADANDRAAEQSKRINAVETITIRLLNETHLSQAKTAVAKGAARARAMGVAEIIAERETTERQVSAFAGLSFQNTKVNDLALPISWSDKWEVDDILDRMKQVHEREVMGITSFSVGRIGTSKEPFDELLKVFLQLSNLASYEDDVNLPPERWQNLNALTHQDRNYFGSEKGLGSSPINYFVADLLYPDGSDHELLRDLARMNKCR